MKFADPKNDVAFRKIFANENKKEILISFLNAILDFKNDKKIKTIEIRNPFQVPTLAKMKEAVLDIKATNEKNISFIIEMQVEPTAGFDKRVQYYAAKAYATQIKRGEDYPKLNQVIFIGILDFNFFNSSNYQTKHLILNTETLEQELKDIELNFIELPKFNKTEAELKTLADKWIYFIKNADNLKIIPENSNEIPLKSAYKEAEIHNWNQDVYDAYDYASIKKQDAIGAIQYAEKRGMKIQRIESEKIIKEKDKTIEQKEKTIEQKEKTIKERDKKFLKTLIELGLSEKEAKTKLGL